VPEYHDAWSVSPDGSQLALGISSGRSLISPSRRLGGRIGILIVDLETMKTVGEVETGIAAEALAWLAPRLLVAALQRGGTVLVDPLTGRTLHRWRGLSEPHVSAHTRDSLVMVFPDTLAATTEGTAAARLAVVDAQGRLRSVALKRIQISVSYAHDAGIAVDPVRARAYVFVADALVADVDLRTMRVSYHRLEPLFLRPGELAGPEAQPRNAVRERQRHAIWLGDGRALIFGRDLVAADGEEIAAIAAGATLVDTVRWNACVLDAKASGAAFVAERLLVYGPGSPVSRDAPGAGLRAYTVEGRVAFHLFDGQPVWDVEVGGDRAYVRTSRAVRVVDVSSGKVVSEIVPPAELVDVIVGPS
jgi:hypothetical protein